MKKHPVCVNVYLKSVDCVLFSHVFTLESKNINGDGFERNNTEQLEPANYY
jgi:hypothetical protein